MRNCSYKTDVCIVGLGPAGIGAALTLSASDVSSQTLCFDVGSQLGDRTCLILQNESCDKKNPCNMISGFGGSSLLGGGKIATLPAGSELENILDSKNLAEMKLLKALKLFRNYIPVQKINIQSNDIQEAKDLFGKLGFEYKYYDVYMFNQDDLQKGYQKILLQLKSGGMSLLMDTELLNIDQKENGFELTVTQGDKHFFVFTKYLLLGIGRLGQSKLIGFNEKLKLKGKENHLDVGVRLEFPTDLYPDINKYSGDLKLLFNDARTFCVCKNGKVSPYLLEDIFFMEGNYNSTLKSGFTNLGILLRLKPSQQNDTIFLELKKKVQQISTGKPIYQRLTDYLGMKYENCDSGKLFENPMYFWTAGKIDLCFPSPFNTKIREAVSHFASYFLPKNRWWEVSVFAPEVDYIGLSFPIKNDFSIIPRMYLMGDCTGRFRGILQAFCSGILCAESIINDQNENP